MATVADVGGPNKPRKELFSLFSKTGFLLNVLRSFHTTKDDFGYLQRSIQETFPEAILSPSKIITVAADKPLVDAFRTMRDRKASSQGFLPASC